MHPLTRRLAQVAVLETLRTIGFKPIPPASESVTSIEPRVFVAHGRDDEFIPADRIAAFTAGLDRAKADWEMTVYSGTRHSFTNPGADSRGIENLAYNKKAATRSWAAMMTMFDEVF